MKLLTEADLLLAGWLSGPHITQMLEAVAAMEARGIQDPRYALKLLRRDFPPPPAKWSLRDQPAPLAQALQPTNALEEKNLGAVCRTMQELLRVPVVQAGAIMPDACPTGSGVAAIPVGGVIAVQGAIIPSAHSEDICCSMYATFFRTAAGITEQLDALWASTRFGAGGRPQEDWIPHPVLSEDVWENPFLQGLERHAAMHLADQGDGNHFAFLGEVEFSADSLQQIENAGYSSLAQRLGSLAGPWQTLVTHHGSRGLGAHVYKRGQRAAEKATAKIAKGIPEAACWLEADSEEGAAYWQALQYVGRWTLANHHCIHQGLAKRLGVKIAASIANEHNYVWERAGVFYHAKGATPAWKDELGRPQLGLIPLNMAEPILIVLGADNKEFLGFAPHGAGRNVSRRAAIKPYLDDNGRLDTRRLQRLVEEQTQGLEIRWWHSKPDLSETPLAYKPAATLKAQIKQFGLAHIVAEIRPRGCIMAGDPGPRRKEEELTPKQIRQIQHRADRRRSKQGLQHWDEDED